jgi:hypothetical protein
MYSVIIFYSAFYWAFLSSNSFHSFSISRSFSFSLLSCSNTFTLRAVYFSLSYVIVISLCSIFYLSFEHILKSSSEIPNVSSHICFDFVELNVVNPLLFGETGAIDDFQCIMFSLSSMFLMLSIIFVS